MEVSLDTKFWFGKYRDKIVKDIIVKDYYYVEWCANTIKDFKLDDDAMSFFVEIGYDYDDDKWMDDLYIDLHFGG